jgi:predicted ArsR family transcriptional regulator
MTPQFRANPHSKGWAPIVLALRAHGQPMTRIALAKAMGKSDTYAQGYLPVMVAAGVVCVTGKAAESRTGSRFGRAPKLYALTEWSA